MIKSSHGVKIISNGFFYFCETLISSQVDLIHICGVSSGLGRHEYMLSKQTIGFRWTSNIVKAAQHINTREIHPSYKSA